MMKLDRNISKLIFLVRHNFDLRTLLIGSFLISLFGRDIKILEIIRNLHRYLIVKRVEKDLLNRKVQMDLKYHSLPVRHDKIFIFWDSPIETAPDIVRKCYEKLLQQDLKVILLNSQNYKQYIKLPHCLENKWRLGKMSTAHFTDLLRLKLLIEHGGIWLDATVYVDGNLPYYIQNSSLFFYRSLKPGLDGNPLEISNWCISAREQHPILIFLYDYLCDRWMRYNQLPDYFYFHAVISALFKVNPHLRDKICPVCNANPHQLWLARNLDYNEDLKDHILSISNVQKLSYKDVNLNLDGLLSKFLEKTKGGNRK